MKYMGNTGEWDYEMDRVWVEEVIIATVARRGDGVDGDPIRIIVQVFSKDGKLIAEKDPIKKSK